MLLKMAVKSENASNLFSSTEAFHISVECTCISDGLLELSVAFVISWTVGFSQGLAQPEVFHP